MTNKPKYSSGKDPLSGRECIYQDVEGRRTPILMASFIDNKSLSLSAVTHNVAMLLNDRSTDVMPLASPARAFYHRPEAGDSMILKVLEGEPGHGTSVDAVIINPTGAHPDLSRAALKAMTQNVMGELCHTFDSSRHPAPQGGPRLGAPNPR